MGGDVAEDGKDGRKKRDGNRKEGAGIGKGKKRRERRKWVGGEMCTARDMQSLCLCLRRSAGKDVVRLEMRG